MLHCRQPPWVTRVVPASLPTRQHSFSGFFFFNQKSHYKVLLLSRNSRCTPQALSILGQSPYPWKWPWLGWSRVTLPFLSLALSDNTFRYTRLPVLPRSACLNEGYFYRGLWCHRVKKASFIKSCITEENRVEQHLVDGQLIESRYAPSLRERHLWAGKKPSPSASCCKPLAQSPPVSAEELALFLH